MIEQVFSNSNYIQKNFGVVLLHPHSILGENQYEHQNFGNSL